METKHSQLIRAALAEDAAFNDLTGIATVAENAVGGACIKAKSPGTLSGVVLADAVFSSVNPSIKRTWFFQNREEVKAGDVVCELSGNLRALLAAERTALNFLQHLSGIATATHSFVDKIAGTGCTVVDTRKTTPGLRALEKQAVSHGGGINHRMDLESGMLIKENHIEACGSITAAVAACRSQSKKVWIEVECETIAEVHEAVEASPDIILLDNMALESVAIARDIVPAAITLEASGNITLDNARDYAETGIDRIAIGAITHSAPSLDLSMRITGNQL